MSERVEQAVRIVERPVRYALHAVHAVLPRVISQLLTPSFVLAHSAPLPLLLLQLYRWWVQEDKDGMSNKRRVRLWRLCCVGERDGKWGAAGGGAAPSNSSTLQLEGRTEDPSFPYTSRRPWAPRPVPEKSQRGAPRASQSSASVVSNLVGWGGLR